MTACARTDVSAPTERCVLKPTPEVGQNCRLIKTTFSRRGCTFPALMRRRIVARSCFTQVLKLTGRTTLPEPFVSRKLPAVYRLMNCAGECAATLSVPRGRSWFSSELLKVMTPPAVLHWERLVT